MAFGAYPYSAAPPARAYGSSSSSFGNRRGAHGHSKRGVWTAFVMLVVAFYGAVIYLFHQHGPSPATPTLRGQQLDAANAAEAAAAVTPHNPPGSVDGVVVLGMHRSGTSMITGLLQRMGLELGGPGTLLGAVKGENDKGFFERIQVINQNDQLMKEQGVNWSLGVFRFDHLEAIRAALSDKRLFAEGMAALAFYNDPANAPWAVKDPRLCFTLKFWMAFWKTPPAVLIVYRHPLEVRTTPPDACQQHHVYLNPVLNLHAPTHNPIHSGGQVAGAPEGVRAPPGPAPVDGLQPAGHRQLAGPVPRRHLGRLPRPRRVGGGEAHP